MCSCGGTNILHRLFVDTDRIQLQLSRVNEITTLEVILTGGEPLLISNIAEVVKSVRNSGARCQLITNGFLLDDVMVEQLIESGLNGMTLSLDGPNAASHDELRGLRGLFEKAIYGAKYMKYVGKQNRADFSLRVNTVVSKYNCDHVMGFIPLLKGLGVQIWSLIPVKDCPSALPDDEQRLKFMGQIGQTLKHLTSCGITCYPECSMSYDDSETTTAWSKFWEAAGNRHCQVLEYTAFVDITRKRLASCNLTNYRHEAVVVPFDWDSEYLVSIWSNPGFIESRRLFRGNTYECCTNCEPANNSLHRRLGGVT
jgi:MoaA/NifB/PqqE/SkfB family radical SAM enzyme